MQANECLTGVLITKDKKIMYKLNIKICFFTNPLINFKLLNK